MPTTQGLRNVPLREVVLLRNWVTPCFGVAPFFVRTILQTTTVLIAPWGGVGKTLSLARPYWGVQHLQINRSQWPF